jgi:hypothetical protein
LLPSEGMAHSNDWSLAFRRSVRKQASAKAIGLHFWGSMRSRDAYHTVRRFERQRQGRTHTPRCICDMQTHTNRPLGHGPEDISNVLCSELQSGISSYTTPRISIMTPVTLSALIAVVPPGSQLELDNRHGLRHWKAVRVIEAYRLHEHLFNCWENCDAEKSCR